MKKYDGLYIFAGNAKDDVLEGSLAKAVAEIERFGGTVEAQEVLGKRTFARPMHKRENGVYAIVRFELDHVQFRGKAFSRSLPGRRVSSGQSDRSDSLT